MFYIAVVGAAVCSAEEKKAALEVGALIARGGGVVVCGGGCGVMEAASAGAHEAGGLVLGILPGNSSHEGNRYLSLSIATGLGEARNAIIARTADVLIAIGGEFGTLSEIALALKMNKPVIGLKTWQLQAPRTVNRAVMPAHSPADAVEKAFLSLGNFGHN